MGPSSALGGVLALAIKYAEARIAAWRSGQPSPPRLTTVQDTRIEMPALESVRMDTRAGGSRSRRASAVTDGTTMTSGSGSGESEPLTGRATVVLPSAQTFESWVRESKLFSQLEPWKQDAWHEQGVQQYNLETQTFLKEAQKQLASAPSAEVESRFKAMVGEFLKIGSNTQVNIPGALLTKLEECAKAPHFNAAQAKSLFDEALGETWVLGRGELRTVEAKEPKISGDVP